jgi:tRNA(Ile)-lysidine synthase
MGANEENPQGLKPGGRDSSLRGAEAPLFHGTAEVAPFQSVAPNPARLAQLDKIATGHTLDDQAETVLMRLIRGTGLRGLGGIHPRIIVEDEDGNSHGEIVRPLLSVRRHELEKYLKDLKQPWREDSSNADSKFTRNRVRSLVLPLLQREFNPAVAENFAELAEIARDEEDYWENEVSGWLGTVVQWSEPEWAHKDIPEPQGLVQIGPAEIPGENKRGETSEIPGVVEMPRSASANVGGQGVLRSSQDDIDSRLQENGPAVVNASLSRPWLLTEPKAVQRRVIKAIGEQVGIPLEFKHIEEVLRFASEDGPSGKELSLPLGWKVRREPEAMAFLTPDLRRQQRIPDYEYSLAVPGRVVVPELGAVIEALRVAPGAQIAEYNPQHLLLADSLTARLAVRNWRPGDRYWPPHTKAPKKIKELLQERHLPQPERRLWPVAEAAGEIVWMRGFPVPAKFCARRGDDAIFIQESPLDLEDLEK